MSEKQVWCLLINKISLYKGFIIISPRFLVVVINGETRNQPYSKRHASTQYDCPIEYFVGGDPCVSWLLSTISLDKGIIHELWGGGVTTSCMREPVEKKQKIAFFFFLDGLYFHTFGNFSLLPCSMNLNSEEKKNVGCNSHRNDGYTSSTIEGFTVKRTLLQKMQFSFGNTYFERCSFTSRILFLSKTIYSHVAIGENIGDFTYTMHFSMR